MESAADIALRSQPLPHEAEIGPGRYEQSATGTSAGVNIAPGSDDDGWTVPPPVTLRDGTRLQLYKDGEALHAAYEAIKHAKRRICLETYIWGDDDTGRAFAELLSKKARDGLRVYVLYDSFGSLATDRHVFRQMRRAGVSVQEFHPVRPWDLKYSWRPFNRDHRKLLVIDDHIAGLGGLNVASEYAGSWVVPPSAKTRAPWRDNAMGIVGPGASLYLQAFASAWNYTIRGGRIRRAELYHNLDRGELGVLGSVPSMSSPLKMFFHDVVSGARQSVELTMAYFAPPFELLEELSRAARRGVRVRLIVPEDSDVRLLEIAAQSCYEPLLCAGVEIYERCGAVLHAKTLVADRETVVLGSTNLDYRSIEYNLELSAIVRNKQFGQQVHGLFEHDVRYSRRINKEEWRRRPLRDRFVQWAVDRVRYLL